MSALDRWERKVVSEQSQEYETWRKREKKRPDFFGESAIREYRRYEEKETDGTGLDQYDARWRSSVFEWETLVILGWNDDIEKHSGYGDVLGIAVSKVFSSNLNLFNDYMALLNEMPTKESFVHNLREGKIPRPILAGFFEGWVNFMNGIQQDFETRFVEDKRHFIELIPMLIAEGVLVPNTDVEKIKKRLDNIAIFALDPLDEHQTNNRQTYGSYNDDSIGILPISLDENSENIDHNIMHELVHAGISGRKLVAEERNFGTTFLERKSGLRFDHTKQKSDDIFAGHIVLYTWLNEAKTEKIARRFSGYKKAIAYQNEIDALEKELIEAGVPDILVTEAYQEDYRVGEKGVRLPRLHELIKKIDEVKGKGWLLAQEQRFKSAECGPLIEQPNGEKAHTQEQGH